MELWVKYKTQFDLYGVDTPKRRAMFMAQIKAESNLLPAEESFAYSLKRLLEIFKSDFDTNRDKWLSEAEKAKARAILGNPKAIANFVYANQNGNGNEASGDGWKFRGRGHKQITGRYNYGVIGKALKLDLINNPDLLLQEANAIIAALYFWKSHNLNKFADVGDIRSCTKVINGGYNGLDKRVQYYHDYLKIMK